MELPPEDVFLESVRGLKPRPLPPRPKWLSEPSRAPQGARAPASVCDNVDLLLQYVFGFGHVHGLPDGVYRLNDQTLALGTRDGVRVSLDEVRGALRHLWGRNLSYFEAREALGSYLASVLADLTSPPDEAS